MIRTDQERPISDDVMDDESSEFDFVGQDPAVQAGMDANARDIVIPSTTDWDPAVISTDYRNRGTFDEVFPPLIDRLFNHARYELNRLGMQHELVEEVMQLAAVTAREHWDKYTQGTFALAWLKKIITNTCYNLRRQVRTRDNREIQIGDPVEFFDSRGFQSASAEKQAIENLRIDELRGYFELLPPDQRDAAKAVILDQLSTNEAAAFLDIPSATLLTRVHRARTRLRAIIEGEHGTEKDN